jgi:hypothetical protein
MCFSRQHGAAQFSFLGRMPSLFAPLPVHFHLFQSLLQSIKMANPNGMFIPHEHSQAVAARVEADGGNRP